MSYPIELVGAEPTTSVLSAQRSTAELPLMPNKRIELLYPTYKVGILPLN